MMKSSFGSKVKNFFFPPPGTPRWQRVLPYLVLGVLSIAVLIAGAYGWEYTNSPEFCGTVCHTMPPEFTSYLTSPHARVDCVECHIGRGFIATRISRKAGDIKHIVSLAFKQYEFPITADDLRPARETCEQCHFPEKFSNDSLQELKRFRSNETNTPISIYLNMKTGGGSRREGLGRGIHWHIENPTLFYATDEHQQDIPYIQVQGEEGQIIEYIDIEADFDPESINDDDLVEMDCITCHNRITHFILPPEDTVDNLLARGAISSEIPEIRAKAIEVYGQQYDSVEQALSGISGLEGYYELYQPKFYIQHARLIYEAIDALQEAYANSVYPEQKADWNSHPDNSAHKDSPGCFRCHDGKHLNGQQEAIRLECNICHSIPVVSGPSDFIAEIEISRGPEPESHLNPNWITLHRDVFDATCENCHSTGNPGGVDNSSFCSNSACHGTVWTHAGFDAPSLREVLQSQLDSMSEPAEDQGELAEISLSYEGGIREMLVAECGSCHGEGGIQDLDVTSFEPLLEGGVSGPAVKLGDPDVSLLIQKQTGEQPHFGQLSPDKIELLIRWISIGAPES